MGRDTIEVLIEKAHQILNGHSVYEVIDLEEEEARKRIVELYGNVSPSRIDAYLEAVRAIRNETG
ncbi:MAG: hypothetical protein KQH59_03565 [Desulfobulbaceae bacterium]|nr:hypothetical protein [Desulfobulbaceae bacterium]